MPASIGEQLKEKRNQLGIQLEDIVSELHIRVEYLQALENDQIDKLPSDVQAKGFLRLYASFLNLDVHDLIAQWNGNSITNETNVNLDSDNQVTAETPDQPGQSTKEDNAVPETTEQGNEVPQLEGPLPLSSSQRLQQLGEEFRQQRKSLQLSLEDIEKSTHIRKNNLAAIEENRFDDLPSSVQARGMIESYAAYINLDVNEIMNAYAEALQEKRKEFQREDESQNPKKKRTPSPKNRIPIQKLITPDLIVGSLLIVAILVVAILSIAKVVNTNQQQDIASINLTQTQDTRLTETMLPTATITIEPTATAQIETLIIEAPSSQVTTPEEESIPVNPNARVQLHLTTNQRAYLRILVDENIEFDGRVMPGAAYQFYADESIQLTTGNASAFSAIIVQDSVINELGILGEVAQVVDMIIQPKVIITPTALPTATPTITNTPLPTQTVTPTPTTEEINP